jgi:hypothetical protein
MNPLIASSTNPWVALKIWVAAAPESTDSPRQICLWGIGPSLDPKAPLLEVMAEVIPPRTIRVFHVMRAREPRAAPHRRRHTMSDIGDWFNPSIAHHVRRRLNDSLRAGRLASSLAASGGWPENAAF